MAMNGKWRQEKENEKVLEMCLAEKKKGKVSNEGKKC